MIYREWECDQCGVHAPLIDTLPGRLPEGWIDVEVRSNDRTRVRADLCVVCSTGANLATVAAHGKLIEQPKQRKAKKADPELELSE